jgi:hypothetical protein
MLLWNLLSNKHIQLSKIFLPTFCRKQNLLKLRKLSFLTKIITVLLRAWNRTDYDVIDSESVGCPPKKVIWWRWQESNLRLPECKSGALPTELHPQTFIGCGDRIWTCDLWVMSPTSYLAAPPRVKFWWWAWVDSNYRPHAYQACALTNWATGP